MISLNLYDSVLNGNTQILNMTDLLHKTWRRSNKSIGGCWLGTAEITVAQVDRRWLDEFFAYGLLREIREFCGGQETWRGAIVKMEYTRGGNIFVYDVSQMANAIRSIYTRIGDNLLTNGSGESGAWTVYNGATVAQSTAWVSHGTYSVLITVADTTIRGARIQSTIAITAGKQYVIRATLRVVSGSWRLSTNRADTDASLAFYSTGGITGDHVVEITIPETNTYTGNVDLRITSEASAGSVYGDACVFQAGPARAETGWYSDTVSVAAFGRKEDILLRGGKSNADANAECQRDLLDRSWPNPLPPQSVSTKRLDIGDKIKITFSGYWMMLNWTYTTLHGTRACSDWVTTLAGLQPTYVIGRIIDTNSTDFFVDDRAPLKLGDLLRDLALAGDSSGNKYRVGVNEKRYLNYERVQSEAAYYLNEGRLTDISGAEVEPWMVRPGWAIWQDLPRGQRTPTAYAQHDPRWVYLDEVEMLPDGEIAFKLE